MKYQGEEWSLTVDGHRWQGRQWGDSEGFPILALHGWLDNSGSFDALAPLLPKNCYFLALDLLGQGLSSHLPPDQSYELRLEALRLEGLVKALAFEHYLIIAHSRGGALGVLLAAMMPEQVKGLVLLDSLGPLSTEIYEVSEILKTFYLKMTARSAFSEHTIYPNLKAAYASRLKVNELTPAALEILARRGLHEVEGGYSWRFDLRLLLPSEHLFTETAVLKCIDNLHCPVLLFRSRRGLLIEHPLLTLRKTKFHHFKEWMVEGGHYAHLNTPELLGADLGQFVLKFSD